jgi:hypothetical protein
MILSLFNIKYCKNSKIFKFSQILAEIELFYLLPHQRRWYVWFPEVM